MMIIEPSQAIYMQRDPRSLCKALNDMGDHLTAQVADLLTLQTEFNHSVRTTREVDDSSRQGLFGLMSDDSRRWGKGVEPRPGARILFRNVCIL